MIKLNPNVSNNTQYNPGDYDNTQSNPMAHEKTHYILPMLVINLNLFPVIMMITGIKSQCLR